MRRQEPPLSFSVDSLQTPFFEPLRPLLRSFEDSAQWPGPENYNELSRARGLDTSYGLSFSDVCDDGMSFEERIAEQGEIQCRRESWHDFFNAMTAITFPRTKLAVNRLQMKANPSFTKSRNPEQNMLAHFEECGVVVMSANTELSEHLRCFRWKELFWRRRSEVSKHVRFLIYGHGLYAKALSPYIGLTGHGVVLDCDEADLNAPMGLIDERTATLLEGRDVYSKPRDLSPIPLLGIPGWHAANGNEDFYEDTSYFRPGRRGTRPTSSSSG